jgi:hypothetical protein
MVDDTGRWVGPRGARRPHRTLERPGAQVAGVEYSVNVRLAGGAVLVAATIGLSVIISTHLAGRAYEARGRQAVGQGQEITVRGSARQRVTSDLAQWSITVRGHGETMPSAFSAVDAATQRVGAYLREAGFGERQVELSAIDTDTHYERDARGHTTARIVGYTLSRTFRVSTPEVDRVARASADVTRLLREGFEVVSLSPQYLISTLPEMRISMMGDAARDARARADELATKSGGAVTEVRRVTSGPFQVTRPDSTDVSGSGSYDTSTIEKDVSVSVIATFGIAPAR